jgi:FkbM family methyltransferase
VAEAMKYVPEDRRGMCVQAGGNFGVWPWLLSKYFQQVHTFEPCELVSGCLRENLKDTSNVSVYGVGLSHKRTNGEFHLTGNNHGAQHINFGNGPVECIALDSLALPGLDLLDLDIEGAEGLALEGARQTVMRFRPTVVVENWIKRGHPGHHAHNYRGIESGSQWLARHGYKMAARISEDEVWLPE